ncbi:MAG: alpha-ketoacid dehydrogenase subunit beta [Thermoplasmatales archaeon]|nr:alpha-ketoacid dehydrogenase subunit beta [Thermoplasmatales archaeon]
MGRKIKYSEAIREALAQSMAKDEGVFIMGLCVDDPKGIFGTTLNLHKEFGRNRVFDVPISENTITGVGIGSALAGMRPVIVHARIDFMFYSMDQIVNHAAKWCYMSGGKLKVPLTIRGIIGRGWGQGAQHSQNPQALFAHIPGLKVVMPATPYDAKGLLIASIEDNNPVIFIEHRWLYNIRGYVPEKMYRVPIGKAKIVKRGEDITIAATSYMTIESIKASKILEKIGVNPEVIDIRTIKPIDRKLIIKSVKKTGRLLVVDSGWTTGGIAAEVITSVVESIYTDLECSSQRICLPDIPTPTSNALTNYFYPRHVDITKKVLKMLNKSEKRKDVDSILKLEQKGKQIPLDVPDLSFTGPF